MAKQRYVNTHFWDDSYIVSRSPAEKLVFLYLLTNPLTNLVGIYEISIRRISFDTGLPENEVVKILRRFELDGKIKYQNGWIAIKNFIKHQKKNPSIEKGIRRLQREVPQDLWQWVISPDKASHVNSHLQPTDRLLQTVDRLSQTNNKLLQTDNRLLQPNNKLLQTNTKLTEAVPKLKQAATNLDSNLDLSDNIGGTYVPPTCHLNRSSGDEEDEVLPPETTTRIPVTSTDDDTMPPTTDDSPENDKAVSSNNHTEETPIAGEEVNNELTCLPAQTDKNNKPKGSCPKDCPHQDIIDLYHEMLPELPRVKAWNERRQKLLRARWREDPERQNLEWWRGFFEIVRNSPFLLGQVVTRDGRTFQADLEWLVRPNNFVKVLEGRYLQRGWEGKVSSVTIHNLNAAREFLERRRKIKEQEKGGN